MDTPETESRRQPEAQAKNGQNVGGRKTALAPEQKIGSYLLLTRLGAGGIGEVWKARDRRLNRVVALKFIATERHGSSPSRELLREARSASALNHPNIVTVFEVGESEELAYLAMEFVEGETLRARLKRPPLALDEALDIATQIVEGLAVAHREGIVHRDLKPENIMLRVDGLVKLMDFGLAKILPWTQQSTAEFSPASAGTESGAIVGTVTYMSPEQARGLRVEPASDVFSFGILFYEMLTAEHPFRAETAMDTLTAILTREPARARARCPSVPQELSELCARALEKDPSQRYSSANDIVEELERARAKQAEGIEGPSAGPIPAARPKPRWMQAVGATLIGILVVLAGWRLRAPSREGLRGPAVQSVAVMNFHVAPDDPRAFVFAQDLPEEVGSALSKVGLQVASRSSVMQLTGAADARTAGAQLGVDAVLEGSVRSYGSKFRVHVELANTRTGFQVWSETITVEGEDLLSSEQKMAGGIATELRQAVTPPR